MDFTKDFIGFHGFRLTCRHFTRSRCDSQCGAGRLSRIARPSPCAVLRPPGGATDNKLHPVAPFAEAGGLLHGLCPSALWPAAAPTTYLDPRQSPLTQARLDPEITAYDRRPCSRPIPGADKTCRIPDGLPELRASTSSGLFVLHGCRSFNTAIN